MEISKKDQADLGKQIKVEVVCNHLFYDDRGYPNGTVLEMSALDAAIGIRQGNVRQAAEGAAISRGYERDFDRLDIAMQKKDYELAKQLAAGIRVPDPALDPKEPATPTVLSESEVQPMKPADFGR